MARAQNASRSKKFRVTLSEQSINALSQLAGRGVFGRNAAEVGGRFIDEALRSFVDIEKIKLEQIKLRPAKASLKSTHRKRSTS